MGIHGAPWGPMGAHGAPWGSVESHRPPISDLSDDHIRGPYQGGMPDYDAGLRNDGQGASRLELKHHLLHRKGILQQKGILHWNGILHW